jgi:hypothetical protein
MKLVLAVDPGKTGAFALFDESGEIIAVDDLAIASNQRLAWVSCTFAKRVQRLAEGRQISAIIERINPNPKNGSIAAFSQGQTLGSVCALCQALGARPEFVSAQVWKKSYGLIFSNEVEHHERKRYSLEKARELFPRARLDLQKHNGRAEALLIGHWYINTRLRATAA